MVTVSSLDDKIFLSYIFSIVNFIGYHIDKPEIFIEIKSNLTYPMTVCVHNISFRYSLESEKESKVLSFRLAGLSQ